MARNRNFLYQERIGSFRRERWGVKPPVILASGVDSTAINAGSKTCADYLSIGPYTDHELDISVTRVIRPRLYCYGAFRSGVPYNYALFMDGYRMPGFSAPYSPALPTPSWTFYAAKAMANINPSRPKIDLPVFAFELKDFPNMLRGLGNVLSGKVSPKDIPGGYLAYRFGWAPLFSDLSSLLGLADLIRARKELLQKAMQKGGKKVHRTLTRKSIDVAPSGNVSTVIASNTECTIRWTYGGSEDWWYTARLLIKPEVLDNIGTLDTAAMRAVLGLNLSAASIWQALPWSWLIDYFANIGDILESNRGWIQFEVKNFNLMCHMRIHGKTEVQYLNLGTQLDPGEQISEYKGRRQPSTAAKFSFAPFLSGSQLAVLGALITKGALSKYK